MHLVLQKLGGVKKDYKRFDEAFYDNLASATRFLHLIVEPKGGRVPNIGANDGANLLVLGADDYRDFRPSLQLASSLFLNSKALQQGPWDVHLDLMAVTKTTVDNSEYMDKKSKTLSSGGYHYAQTCNIRAILKFPIYKFRPSQADFLHLDVWLGDINLLRDAGSYSYNAEETFWFQSIGSHNTIQFDNRDPMPRLGRFLFGNWVNCDYIKDIEEINGTISASAGYEDRYGARHHRDIIVGDSELICRDTISGIFDIATLSWRLANLDWSIETHEVIFGAYSIMIFVNGERAKPIIENTFESTYYLKKDIIPVLRLDLSKPCTIETIIRIQ